MNKGTPNKSIVPNLDGFCKSTFTLTFVIEIIGLEVWHDCNEGWLDLGTCYQAMKVQYQLYPGQSFDVDVLMWPHVVKVWCGMQYGWARTWQFLERRWFAFSIRHAFPVRVADLRSHIATITSVMGFGSLGANAKNDKNLEVYLPQLKFGEKRYFAGVIESEQSVVGFLQDLIWKNVEAFIPSSYLDGLFDTPRAVSDVRHQDAVIEKVHETILCRSLIEEEFIQAEEVDQARDRRESKFLREKKKTAEVQKLKYEIKLSGDTLLSGVGKVIQFETVGDHPVDQGEMIVLISTNNLPAQDDLPMIFVNIEKITNVPTVDFIKSRVTHLYTRWNIGNDIHESEKQPINIKRTLNFSDHHTVLLHNSTASRVTAEFLDNSLIIEIRGTRLPSNRDKSLFYEKIKENDKTEILDIPIAIAKLDTSPLSKGVSACVREECSLFPPQVGVHTLDREDICTNDTNGIGNCSNPEVIIIQPAIILDAQMTLEVSIGFVGCKPRGFGLSFSRLFCIVSDSNAVLTIVRKITEINDQVLADSARDNLLTGFAVDAGDRAVLCVEGRRHGSILRVWHLAQNFYSRIKMLFSTSSNYASRLYPDLVAAPVPFIVLKMYAPLSVLLACPQTYVRPTLPLPTRSALLKLGGFLANKLRTAPCRSDLPTSEELKSFRLELCSPPRPGSCLFDFNLVPNTYITDTTRLATNHRNKS
ncbi:uncharacterized protein LOC110999905 isoform X1 [Pieris rapae]|uniref:uncharacterized protein LOC110999905 isoform X1 n=2 Tax=Pieris rapae TaxID=64459 RepID=UPI001E27BF5B|nr:uncharacterized protein LOC110999905 isoform X1 [Pieris rapae]XP_045485402.1 uncharacterized protein LOC110999905 isoform X1 [Pieris rapae]